MVSVGVNPHAFFPRIVNRCGLAVRHEAGKQKDFGSIRFGSPLSSKIVVYGHCLVTLATQLMKHENAQLPALMQSHPGDDNVMSRCLI